MNRIVKRITLHNLGPFDYTQEVYTPLLWVMEGFTTYYDLLLLRRAGLIKPKRTLELYAERIATYLQQPGRLVQSLEESSLTAWIKFYRQDENYVNTGISYYLKGSLVALILDFHLRMQSDNRTSLDDLLAHLWEHYGKLDVGFTPEQFFQAIEVVGGEEVAAMARRYTEGIEALPLQESLALAGLQLELSRKGDTPDAWLGILTKVGKEGVVVRSVLREGPAEVAGLMAADHLLAIDGYKIRDEDFLSARLREKDPGDTVDLHLFRYGMLLEKQVTLGETPPDKAVLRPRGDATPQERRVLEAWLATGWEEIV